MDRLAAVTPAYAPGEQWEYSNANYEILGRLVEVVSGQEFQAYVATNILEPVGMEHSFVADGEIHESMATGHTPWFGTKRPLPTGVTDRGTAPQGGIVATAGDLARYLLVMMNGRDDVLSAAGKALMMRPAGGASPFYGFGWFVDSGNGSVWHSGSSPGFESLATMVPAEQKGVVVLVNGGSGMGFGETAQLRNGITARALGLDYDGEGSRVFQKATFIGLVLLPIIYLISMAWAWIHRAEIRAKSGVPGLFSLWSPLLTTLVAAWVMLRLVPSLFGAPLGTIRLFQPDLGLVLIAAAVTGVLWAVFRLGVAYTGDPTPPDLPGGRKPAAERWVPARMVGAGGARERGARAWRDRRRAAVDAGGRPGTVGRTDEGDRAARLRRRGRPGVQRRRAGRGSDRRRSCSGCTPRAWTGARGT